MNLVKIKRYDDLGVNYTYFTQWEYHEGSTIVEYLYINIEDATKHGLFEHKDYDYIVCGSVGVIIN